MTKAKDSSNEEYNAQQRAYYHKRMASPEKREARNVYNRDPDRVKAKHEYDKRYRELNKEELKIAGSIRQKNNRPAANKRNRKYHNTTLKVKELESPQKYLWKIAKGRAKRDGIPFDIQPEDIVVFKTCPITGVEMGIRTNVMATSLSLDRVINDKGYIKGNVVAISRLANIRKSNMGVTELQKIISYIQEFGNENFMHS